MGALPWSLERNIAMTTSRYIQAINSIGKEFDQTELKVIDIHGEESLSHLFNYRVKAHIDTDKINLDTLLYKGLGLKIDTNPTRYIHGIVTRIKLDFVEIDDIVQPEYQLVLEPWLWFLTQTSDCRIFSGDLSTVIKTIFSDHSIAPDNFDLSELFNKAQYHQKDQTTQYRETAFEFMSRLLEQEGIYYYFKYHKDRHVLHLCDSSTHISEIKDYKIDFSQRNLFQESSADYFYEWKESRTAQSSKSVKLDYDYSQSQAKLNAEISNNHELIKTNATHSSIGLFEYPAGANNKSNIKRYAELETEQAAASVLRIQGKSVIDSLAAGAMIKTSGHPNKNHPKSYLVTHAEYTIINRSPYIKGRYHPNFFCEITAQDGQYDFVPERKHRLPFISCPQSATVVGKSPGEIERDDQGRIKLKMAWDRNPSFSASDAIWVRVSQLWAGNQFGSLFTPRVGDEVIVEFIDGDPDRPIVTGSVYNDTHLPPFRSNKEFYTTGIRSQSEKGTHKEFNEISFNDKKSNEELKLTAAKDHLLDIKNDYIVTVNNQRSITITDKDTLEAKGDISITSTNGDIFLTAGKSSITLKKSGTVEISGKKVIITGDSGIELN